MWAYVVRNMALAFLQTHHIFNQWNMVTRKILFRFTQKRGVTLTTSINFLPLRMKIDRVQRAQRKHNFQFKAIGFNPGNDAMVGDTVATHVHQFSELFL